MDPAPRLPALIVTRRRFLGQAGLGIGAAALAELLQCDLLAQSAAASARRAVSPGLPHFAPKAKRVIYMFQSGAPSQLDLFDYKPQLAKTHGTDLPDSIRQRPAVDGDDRRADELSDRAIDLQVCATWAIGRMAQ